MDWINKIYVWFNYRWTECVVVERREKKRWNHKSFSFLVSVQHLVTIYDVCLKTRTSDVWVCVCMDVVLCMWIFETTRNRKIQPQQKSNPTKQFMNILSARWQTASINDELCAGFFRVFFKLNGNVCAWLAAILVWTKKATTISPISVTESLQQRRRRRQQSYIPKHTVCTLILTDIIVFPCVFGLII